MQDGSHAAVLESHWEGGVSPFAASWQKTMMWIFIVTDGLLFSGLLSGYGFLRMSRPGAWPVRSEVFHIWFIALMTFILITSSMFMGTAVTAARLGDRKKALSNLIFTIVGGLCFLGCQAYEWTNLIREGYGLVSNPTGVPQFGASFFVLTGFHGSHVLSGLVILTITAIRWAMDKTPAQNVEMAGLYWHFVDLVWVFIFTLFYLL
ncbi:MAG TPA: cytochrome c oxidase subunit 3 [Vicinamibacteria bacterium]|jgi:cytochrome c oxidase subunit 3|nr:cytochrome c oxidase subunit 3 [Vicinamibacteria bacterium]